MPTMAPYSGFCSFSVSKVFRISSKITKFRIIQHHLAILGQLAGAEDSEIGQVKGDEGTRLLRLGVRIVGVVTLRFIPLERDSIL